MTRASDFGPRCQPQKGLRIVQQARQDCQAFENGMVEITGKTIIRIDLSGNGEQALSDYRGKPRLGLRAQPLSPGVA
mgnify:CR=1